MEILFRLLQTPLSTRSTLSLSRLLRGTKKGSWISMLKTLQSYKISMIFSFYCWYMRFSMQSLLWSLPSFGFHSHRTITILLFLQDIPPKCCWCLINLTMRIPCSNFKGMLAYAIYFEIGFGGTTEWKLVTWLKNSTHRKSHYYNGFDGILSVSVLRVGWLICTHTVLLQNNRPEGSGRKTSSFWFCYIVYSFYYQKLILIMLKIKYFLYLKENLKYITLWCIFKRVIY